MSKLVSIQVLRRPWYEWLLWALWAALELFVAQNALASAAELEPRAASIFWITFVVLLLAGGIIWFVRRAQLLK